MENEEQTTEEVIVEKTNTEKVTENYKTLKAANDKVEEELLRAEELKAKVALGGKSDAGAEEEVKEETNQEYVDKMRKNGWKADG